MLLKSARMSSLGDKIEAQTVQEIPKKKRTVKADVQIESKTVETEIVPKVEEGEVTKGRKLNK